MQPRALPALPAALFLCLWGSPGQSQSPAPVAEPGRATFAAELRAPIHTHPDDPTFGPYGTWAMGPDYKVSFHDGFTFYPLLGPTYPENLPFAWRTESVRIGDQPLLAEGDRPRHASTSWRYEYRYDQFVEAYDVRADGVEQTFVLASRPEAVGDWVVTGRCVTRLTAAHQVSAHAALTFHDAAQVPLVRYGEAFAVDANGDKVRAETSFDGDRIQLRVDGAWLAQARFPVVLDPLTSRVLVNAILTLSTVRETDVGHDGRPSGTADTVMVSFTRVHAADDLDTVGYMTDDTFLGASLVFSDASTTLISERPSVAFVIGTNQWAIAFQRSNSANTVSQIRLWAHARGNPTPAGGQLMFLGLTAVGTTDRNPDVGGAMVGTDAFVVYQTDVTTTNANTNNTEVHGVVVDLANHTWGTPFRLGNTAAGTTYDRENPGVGKIGVTRAGESWITVWQELNRTVTDNWDIVSQRIADTGQRVAQATLTAGGPTTEQAIQPEVDGTGERYVVAYLLTTLLTATNGNEIRTTRFNAPASSSSMTVLSTRTVAGPLSINSSVSDLDVSFDRLTHSHWAVAWEQRSSLGPVYSARIVRVGHTGGIVEMATMHSGNISGQLDPGVCCQVYTEGLNTVSRFLVTHAAPESNAPVYGQTLLYDPAAVNVLVGTGCGGTISADPPLAGDEYFTVRLSTGLGVSTSAILFLSAGPGSVDLSAAGMTGCFLNVDPAFFLTFPAAAPAGLATFPLSLPDAPAFFGNVWFQWLWVSPGANPANLKATRGLLSAVR